MYILSASEATPLYKQLYHQMRSHVLSGKLPADSKLPSVRDMAAELSASRNTVDGAYQELLAEGYIYSKPRSGFYVSALEQETVPNPQGVTHSKQDFLPGPPSVAPYDFHPARLDPESFPAELWRKCYVESLRSSGQQLLHYGEPQGDWGLRCSVQSYLERSRGVRCDPEQVVICAGLQQGLDMVAHIMKGAHAAIAVENPGYHLPRAVFQSHGYTIHPIPVGEAGLDVSELKASSSTIVYVTPSHQLPLGQVMPVASRLALIEWAESGGRYIIEDDYDSELRYQGKPIPSLQGLHPSGNIIYSGTFSKILSPALRLSYVVLPYSLLAAYRAQYRDYFSCVPLLEQRAMALFMGQGHWERHIRRMRILYKKKHDAVLRAVETYFGSQVTIVGQGAGLHVVLMLSAASLSEAEILDKARQKGLYLYPFSGFYAADHPTVPMLLLGFGGMRIAQLEQGIAQLARICLA